jgi:carboxyl-terminal processing protease
MLLRKQFILWIMILAIIFSMLFIGKWGISGFCIADEPYSKLKLFTEVLSLVKRNYVEEVNDKDLVYGAIKGMLTSLDPHSSFLTPEMYKEIQIDTSGEFGGLGIQIGMKDGIVTVIAPIEDTPAYKIGVKAGDKILKINNELTKDMSLHDAVSKLRGPKGTKVTITILREGHKKTMDFTIVRDIIKVKSVKSKVIERNIGYVKLTQFQEKSADDLALALNDLKSKGINSLILDLRNNPGGLLNVSIDVAGQFLPSNKLVVYIKNKQGKKDEFKTKDDYEHLNFPMVVLVNEGSASASEIVAGALKDWKRALIIGEKTFGKASVQTVIPLSDGSGLRLTTAKYYTPSGLSIQATGITPDIEVSNKEAEKKKHPSLRESDLKHHLTNEQIKDNKVIKKDDYYEDDEEEITVDEGIEKKDEDDVQLQKAIEILKSKGKYKIFLNS